MHKAQLQQKKGIQWLFDKNYVTTFDKVFLNTYVFLVELAILRFSGKNFMIKSIVIKYCMCNKACSPQLVKTAPKNRCSLKCAQIDVMMYSFTKLLCIIGLMLGKGL